MGDDRLDVDLVVRRLSEILANRNSIQKIRLTPKHHWS